MKLKDARPGRYQPTCRKCGRKFKLHIPDDQNATPVVSKPADPDKTRPPRPSRASETAVAMGNEEAVAPAASPHAPSPQDCSTDDENAGAGDPTPGAAETRLDGNVDATLAPDKPRSSVFDATTAPIPRDADATVAPGSRSQQPGSSSPQPGPSSPRIGSAAPLTGKTLGGYRLLHELGRGAMGAVYAARQLSLDRVVALKLLQDDIAQDPRFIARFTREAYAAAQLTHHNVVQIYDLGAEHDTHFFSMELVDGESLAELVQRDGKLEPKLAVSYTLQAARGLHYAHELGMVHRDVKPGNLLLNKLGVVKVADLGLVKTRSGDSAVSSGGGVPTGGGPTGGVPADGGGSVAANTDVTMRNLAMGTPAYMAPEQAKSAADVDQRADIYSLGCTLYVLLTGRPLFDGASAAEVITKHQTAAVVRPEVIVDRVPTDISDIVMKMVAKNPDDRYGDLRQVIDDMERFLGIKSAADTSPREEDVAKLEQLAELFRGSPTGRLRPRIHFAFSGLCLLVGLLCMFLGQWSVTLGAVGVAVLTPLCYLAISGVFERTFLMSKIRELIFNSSWGDYLLWIVTGILLVVAIVVLQLTGVVVGAAIISAGAACGLYFLIDRRVASERSEAMKELNQLLKTLRIRGTEEDALRRFVAQYSGADWEELFETLFGYEAKLDARRDADKMAGGKPRRRHAVWRDAVIRRIDARLQTRRDARQQRHLKTVEQAELQADGMSASDAQRHAESRAAAMVEQAAQLHATLAATALEQNPQVAAARKRERVKAMLEAARTGADGERPARSSGLIASLLRFPFSGKARFLLGALLLTGCALWLRQNDVTSGGAARWFEIAFSAPADLQRLQIPLLPDAVAGLFSSMNAGIAGILLLLSAILFRGYRISLFVLPAAAVMVFGSRLGAPGLLGLSAELVSLVIGCGIAALGLLFGRGRD